MKYSQKEYSKYLGMYIFCSTRNPAATVTANNIPVLLLPGDTFTTRQPDTVLQQVEQERNASFSTNDENKPVTKY
ncbi:hypothetical protein [Clostridium sp.]